MARSMERVARPFRSLKVTQTGPMRKRILLAILTLMAAASPASAASDPANATTFSGLGAWVDIFDGAAWARPEAAVANMDRHGVKTLYLQTASSRPGPDVFRPDVTARFMRAAHARGMNVIAWY